MKSVGETFLFRFDDQPMLDIFCSNSECIVLFFLGAWVCIEYKEQQPVLRAPELKTFLLCAIWNRELGKEHQVSLVFCVAASTCARA